MYFKDYQVKLDVLISKKLISAVNYKLSDVKRNVYHQ